MQLDSSRNISSSTRRPPLLGSWFEANIPVLSSMLPHITQYDAGPWLSFFIESRLWQFETVPTFVEGTDIHRCDNEYAAHVFRLLADRSPRLKRISYRIINTMNGPLRTPLPIFTHFALIELNFTPYTAGALLCTCQDMKIKVYTFLRDRELLHALFASHRHLRHDEERVQTAYPYQEREHEYCLTHNVPTLALQTLQMRAFKCPSAPSSTTD